MTQDAITPGAWYTQKFLARRNNKARWSFGVCCPRGDRRVIPPSKAIRTTGGGAALLLVHGTAVDGDSWTPLSRVIGERARVTRYDRRGTTRWPVGVEGAPSSVAEHADDLIDLIASFESGPVTLLGASFGAVVALEGMLRRPDLVAGAVLFDPAVAGLGNVPEAPRAFLAEFEKQRARGVPERASEAFHRRVLGDALWKRLPPSARDRARAAWRHVHGDLNATVHYRVAHEALANLDVPCLLLRGEHSPAAFEQPLSELAAALPRVRRAVVPRAGHQDFSAAWRELADMVVAFMAE
jgi:pimeloyl-ACP methyl ester carboxylesterase